MQYKKIKDYEQNYVVYENGDIYNIKMKRFLKPVFNGRYNVVLLYKNGIRKQFYVHRIVAEQFCIKKDNCTTVNHIDLNKQNNHYTNLEWLSIKDNIIHYMKSDRYKKPILTENGKKRIKEFLYKKVVCFDTNKVFNSISEYAEHKKISLPQASMKLNDRIYNNLNAKLLKDYV